MARASPVEIIMAEVKEDSRNIQRTKEKRVVLGRRLTPPGRGGDGKKKIS